MKIFNDIKEVASYYPNPVIAIGVFDGLHRGHQKLLKSVIEKAARVNGTSMVMTFFPHPIHVLRPDIKLPLIISFPHRLKLIQELGIDVTVVLNFTKRFAKLTPENFVKKYIVQKIRPCEVIVGDDFRFGQNRTGTLDDFENIGQKFGFKVSSIKTARGEKKFISSTTIRELIAKGHLNKARYFLNRPVGILGHVIHGDGRGKSIGYPTANIKVDAVVLPPIGVYIVKIKWKNQTHYGVANIGYRPSFQMSREISIEVHILDFKKNLYKQELLIEFIQRLRDEQRFFSTEELVAQIQKDEKKARQFISRFPQ